MFERKSELPPQHCQLVKKSNVKNIVTGDNPVFQTHQASALYYIKKLSCRQSKLTLFTRSGSKMARMLGHAQSSLQARQPSYGGLSDLGETSTIKKLKG